jgi:hypothetical protein
MTCRRAICAACLSLALSLLVAPMSASAAFDPVGSGTVRLRFDRTFLAFLRVNHVNLRAASPGRLGGGALITPIEGGTVDPVLGKAAVDVGGGFALQNARNTVRFKDLTVKTKPSPLIAKVGGSQLKIATSGDLRSARQGFGSTFGARELRLTEKVATRLNKKLRPRRLFAAGQLLGSIAAKANPQLVTVLGQNRGSLELNPAFVAKLNERFVSVNPIFPAEHSGATFSLPLLGGSSISPQGSLGILKLGGAMEFLQLSTNGQIFMQELWVDFGARLASPELDLEPSPPFPGKLGRVGALDLAGGSVAAESHVRTITVSGLELTMKSDTAKAFNDAFAEGGDIFRAGEAVGALSFVAQGQ